MKHNWPNLMGGNFANCIWIWPKVEAQLTKPCGGNFANCIWIWTKLEAQLTKPHGGKVRQLYLNLSHDWSTVAQTLWGGSSLIVFESAPNMKHSWPNLMGGNFANCMWIWTTNASHQTPGSSPVRFLSLLQVPQPSRN